LNPEKSGRDSGSFLKFLQEFLNFAFFKNEAHCQQPLINLVPWENAELLGWFHYIFLVHGLSLEEILY